MQLLAVCKRRLLHPVLLLVVFNQQLLHFNTHCSQVVK